jgi:hypothetical protein
MIIKFVKKNLLICPSCEKKGFKEILGEVDDRGGVLVKRFHTGYTRIMGGNFFVECGRCNEQVYVKERRQDEGNFKWLSLVHRITFSQGSVIQELQRGTYNTGTALLA